MRELLYIGLYTIPNKVASEGTYIGNSKSFKRKKQIVFTEFIY